ncbi:MAG TPA: type I methionyl aminopeptidase [Polyangiaceae bacterium]
MGLRTGAIDVKTPKEIALMRNAGRLAAETLQAVGPMIRPGITTREIDDFVHQDTLRLGCIPAPLNYRGFPKSCCTSINEVICHGIPSDRVLREGDIINVDVTHIYEGFHGDTSATFFVGEVPKKARHVTEVSRRCLELGIAQVKPGARLGDIGAAIQEYAEREGCSVVRAFVGHGIGRRFHEEPQVSHVGQWGRGARLKPGMTFTIEPMINVGSYEVRILDDEWTAVTADGSLSAQFEHTVLVTLTGVEILTARSGPLANSES